MFLFHCNGQELATAARNAARIIDRKATVPHARLFRLELRAPGLTIQATDHAQVLEVACDAQIGDPGVFFVDAQILQAAMKGFTDGPASGQVKGEKSFTLIQENLRVTIPTVACDTWPSFSEHTEAPAASAELSGDWLRQVGKTFRACVSRFTDRIAMSGVCFDFTEEPALVATDGRRLAVAELAAAKWERSGPGDLRPVVPASTMAALHHLGKGQALSCQFTPDRFAFTADGWRLWGKTLAGRFPDHAKVTPSDRQAICFVERQKLRQVLDHLVHLATCQRSPGLCVFHFLAGSGLLVEITDESNTEEVRAKHMIPCQHGPHDLRVGFNARFLLDYLKAVPGDMLQIDLQDTKRAAVFSCGDAPRYILMPVKLWKGQEAHAA